MPGTFLGKWRIYVPKPDVHYFASDGYGSYETSEGPNPDNGFCVWYLNNPDGYYPPGKAANIAFILRADGQLCFLLNNGQYPGPLTIGFQFVGTLEAATGFAFPGHNPQSLPTPFTGTMQSSADGTFVGILWGAFMSGQDQQDAQSYTISQVTPTLPSVQASGNGDGLDFAWVDLTGGALDGVSLLGADFSNCNLTNARLTHCLLRNATLINCHLTGTDFSNSILLGANLSRATFTQTNLSSTLLAGAIFNQDDLTSAVAAPIPEFYNKPLVGPSATNPRTTLAGCRLNQSLLANDWSMLDLTGATILGLSSPLSSKTNPLQVKYSILTGLNTNNLGGLSLQSAVFDNSVLDGLSLNSSDLTNASFIETSMHGTDLSNATLEGANMTGAQLGSLSRLFTLDTGCETDLDAGSSVGVALGDQFKLRGILLSSTATLSNLAPNRVWQLNDAGNNIIYTIRPEMQADSTKVRAVYKQATSASLVGAYMPNAVLTGANLYGITANNIQFYGSGAKVDGSTILEEAKLNSSNLSTVNFTQAQLLGANLSDSYLFNAKFNKASLTTSAGGVPADLSNSNLQGADFTDAHLDSANLTNAAVAVNTPTKGNPNQGGVYLFSLPYTGDTHTVQQYTAELTAAAAEFSLNPQGDSATLQKYVTALETNNLGALKIPFLKQHPPIKFSQNAQIETVEVGSVWQIIDGQTSYTLWTDIDESGNTELYAAPSLTNMQAAFQQNDITLRWQASASVDTAGSQWLIDNDSENPQNFSTGYVRFLLILNGSVLDVYGTALRIIRLGDGNQQVYDNETCNVTTLSVTNMDGNTICPNGATLSVNQSKSGKTWDGKWLRAATKPPAPPTCVPTDRSWCQPSQTTEQRTGNSS